ncbi:MAG: hypothetical protein IPN34_11755 [Planctomycetes bacterium]|nr:hypothetical protein [Planctomycetota bacterium]
MQLRPQDLLLALKLAVLREVPSLAELGSSLGLSASQCHMALKRAATCGLVDGRSRRVRQAALLEFLVHGAKYVFPARRGPQTRGIPTAHSAPPLRESISGGEDPCVWPDPEGELRGEALHPLYKTAPLAARRDPALHELLALLDAVRAGRARERNLAVAELERRIALAPL